MPAARVPLLLLLLVAAHGVAAGAPPHLPPRPQPCHPGWEVY
eukprot:gene10999-biopygen1986